MHKKKKFIQLPGGRTKRSRHRTKWDRLGVAEGKGWKAYEKDKEAFYREFQSPLGSAPKSFRKQLEREFRAKQKHLMRNARYDDLPTKRRRDADWNWW